MEKNIFFFTFDFTGKHKRRIVGSIFTLRRNENNEFEIASSFNFTIMVVETLIY